VKIFIGADHNGFEYKQELTSFLVNSGYDVEDVGNTNIDPNDDFPQFAGNVVNQYLSSGEPNNRGILICGSGQGMCMAANRFNGIRASLCWNLEEARASRNDDDSNILCLSSRYLSLDESQAIINVFLNTAFAGAPRFVRRLQELDQLT